MTDPRKSFWIEISGDHLRSYDYDFNVNSTMMKVFPYFNLSNRLNLGLESLYEKCNNQPGYVDHDSDTGVIYFGKRNRETVVNTFESSYVFNNKISLTFRLRHYHSRVNYISYYRLKSDGRLEHSEFKNNNNINYNAFNIDFTLRWNFAHGSEVLLNWKNSIYTSDQFLGDNYWQNFVSTLDAPQINSISLKVIYYFDI